jgi:hypothetical protein
MLAEKLQKICTENVLFHLQHCLAWLRNGILSMMASWSLSNTVYSGNSFFSDRRANSSPWIKKGFQNPFYEVKSASRQDATAPYSNLTQGTMKAPNFGPHGNCGHFL